MNRILGGVLAWVLLLALAAGCGGGGGLVEGGRGTTPGIATANLRIQVRLDDPARGEVSAQQSSSSQSVLVEVLDRQSGNPVISPVLFEVPSGSSFVEVPVFGVPPGLWRVAVSLLVDGEPVGSPAVADVEVLIGQITRVALSLGGGTFVTREFVVAANPGDDTLAVFQADLTTSALTPVSGSPFTTGAGTGPNTLVFDPSMDFFYLTLTSIDHVAQYRLDPVTGTPSFVNQFATGQAPLGNAMDPLGRFLYVVNFNGNSVSAYTIDATTGALTAVGAPVTITGGVTPQTAYVEPLGRFLYVGEGDGSISQLYAFSINQATGALTQVGGPIPGTLSGVRIFGMLANPAGTFLYATGGGATGILGYDINPTTGALSPNGNFPVMTPGVGATGGLVLDPVRNVLYTSGFFENDLFAFPVNPDNSLGAMLPAVGTGGDNPILLALNPTREALYLTNTDQVQVSTGSVAAFRLGSNGAPTTAAGSPFSSGQFTFGIGVARYTQSQ